MKQQTATIGQVAVLGAGVMGAQIAAHLINAGVNTKLYDLAGKKDPQEIVAAALKNLIKLKPAPFAINNNVELLQICNYQEHLEQLRDCDLIIEVIAERLDLKEKLYQQICEFVTPGTIFVSNTSGLSITRLAGFLPKELQANFCGMHFFNPPRYMPLVELIPHAQTKPETLNNLETFLVITLGKSVVRAKDTVNFVANRVGLFSLLATLQHAEKYQVRASIYSHVFL